MADIIADAEIAWQLERTYSERFVEELCWDMDGWRYRCRRATAKERVAQSELKALELDYGEGRVRRLATVIAKRWETRIAAIEEAARISEEWESAGGSEDVFVRKSTEWIVGKIEETSHTGDLGHDDMCILIENVVCYYKQFLPWALTQEQAEYVRRITQEMWSNASAAYRRRMLH